MEISNSTNKKNSSQIKDFGHFHKSVQMDTSTPQLIVKTELNAESTWLSTVAGKDKKLLETFMLPKLDIFHGLLPTMLSLSSLKWAKKVPINSKNAGTPGDQMILLLTRVFKHQL